MQRMILTSLTRIADLEAPFDVASMPQEQWENGDYVAAEVVHAEGPLARVELPNGRIAEVTQGDQIVGALGVRAATLEVAGSYQAVGPDFAMHLLTAAGLCGKMTSKSPALSNPVTLEYMGHLARRGQKLTMQQFGLAESHAEEYSIPTILIVGTSMSAGKTTTSKILIRELRRRGLQVAGAKLTGAGRYRDILTMSDAGADPVFDFVDVGLPSSILPKEEYTILIRRLLRHIQSLGPDLLIVEAGASPLEPYNGQALLDELRGHVKCKVLCASDPYAALGVMHAFRAPPHFVAGLATSTEAGRNLIEKLTNLPALNILDPTNGEALDKILTETLDLAKPKSA